VFEQIGNEPAEAEAGRAAHPVWIEDRRRLLGHEEDDAEIAAMSPSRALACGAGVSGTPARRIRPTSFAESEARRARHGVVTSPRAAASRSLSMMRKPRARTA